MRTIIDLPAETLAALAQLCAREGVSRAELVRRALARYVAEYGANDEASEAFGLWAGRHPDALAYEDELRGPRDTAPPPPPAPAPPAARRPRRRR